MMFRRSYLSMRGREGLLRLSGRRARPESSAGRAIALSAAGFAATMLLIVSISATTAVAASLVMQVQDWLEWRSVAVAGSPVLDAGLPQSATILARDETILAEINDVHYGHRVSVPLTSVAPNMIFATVAAEDQRFFTHNGVDPFGVVRAVGQNLRGDGIMSGASTLEMQLVRNLFLQDERHDATLSRKVKEAVAAVQLDQVFDKTTVIEAYLNTVYYGNLAYGVEAAARRYFGKSASDLTLVEAALLAGLPQSPSVYDPTRNPEDATTRRDHVLQRMADSGFITMEEASVAAEEPILLAGAPADQGTAPHWSNYIQDLARERFGPDALFTGGLHIQTTIDLEVQQIAEQVVWGNEGVRRLGRANNTAVVVIDPRTSQVLAMVGSKDFNDTAIAGQVNVALARRQPGSSIKPLVYLAGFERGLNPATELVDAITAFPAPPGQPAYMPANYENKYYGRVTIRDALGNSLNVPAVKVLKYTGVPAFLDLARRFGITTLDSWNPQWLSLTLGGGEVRLLELTNAYATITRLGEHMPPEVFTRVETSRGEVIYKADPQPTGEQVADSALVYQLLHVMGDPSARQVTFGPASPLNLPRPHMVKTGTTDDYRDTWTIGCVPQVCVGVWMGNTNAEPMVKVSSSLTAGKIWVETIQALIAKNKWEPEHFRMPEGIVFRQVRSSGGARPRGGMREEVFLPGSQQGGLLEMDWRRW
jgi:penicillin-binding protein 1C